MDGHMFDGLDTLFKIMVPLSMIGLFSFIYWLVKLYFYLSQHLHWIP